MKTGPEHSLSNGNEEDDGGDIVVVGIRERRSDHAHTLLPISPAAFADYRVPQVGGGGILDRLPTFLRRLFDLETTMHISEQFSPQHVRLIQQAVARLSRLPEFRAKMDELWEKGVRIDFERVTRSDQIAKNALGQLNGLNDDDTVSPGAKLEILIRTEFGGEPRSARQIAETIIHELVHAMGVPEWTARLHAPGSRWDSQITNAAFADFDFQLLGSASDPSRLARVESTGPGGGYLAATAGDVILVGSNLDDTIRSFGNSQVFSGEGNDRIEIASLSGTVLIRDDGGQDTLVLPTGVDIASVRAVRSADGLDIGVHVSGMLVASIADAAGAGAIEQIEIAGRVHPMSAFVVGANAPPVAPNQMISITGVHQGYVGSATAHDPDGSTLRFSLASIDGTYSDREWLLSDDGRLFTRFTSDAGAGSGLTQLTIVVSDGLNSVQKQLMVHWMPGTRPFPELRFDGLLEPAADPAPLLPMPEFF